MWILIDHDARGLQWADSLDALADGGGAEVVGSERARALIDALLRDQGAAARLSRLLHTLEPGAARGKPLELRDRFARLIRSHRVRIAEVQRHAVFEWGQGEKDAEVADKTAKELAEISYQVVDDPTGDPIPGVPLWVRLPDGSEVKRQTDGEGMVRFEGIQAGRCAVRAERGDKDLLHVLAFAAFGLHRRTSGRPNRGVLWERPTVDALESAGKRKTKGTVTAIAVVVEHRVRTGDTFASIAERYGLVADELVKFNFGTTERREVQRHLRREVGCRRRDPDTGEYLFDNKDKPGIIYVPRTWEAPNQTTGNDYVIRVHRIEPYEPPFVYSA